MSTATADPDTGERRRRGIARAGDVVRIDRNASVQFACDPFNFRVIRVNGTATADDDGWVWLDGYRLDDAGDAVEHRSLFVQRTGIRVIPPGRR